MIIGRICEILIYFLSKTSVPSAAKNELTKVLRSAAKALNWKNYDINLNLNTILGDGFLSEFYKVSLINNITDEEIKLAVKKAPESVEPRTINAVEFCYKNEILFYSKIYPALQEFEKKHKVGQFFNLVPQYITSVSDVGKEILVLKDITFDGFQLRDKKVFLDDEHTRLIFKTYGHFHAISFCLKKQEPKKFQALVKPAFKIWNKMIAGSQFKEYFKKTVQQSYDALIEEEDNLIRQKFEEYVLNSEEKFKKATCYHGKYSGLLHGDCWSNNMMFKYKDYLNQKVLEEVKLLDFQIIYVGTPVFDLSYFFYSGVSAELFDKLEEYLNVYYESFTQAASDLGENSEELLPREQLSQNFKQYAKLGMMIAFIVTKIKAINNEDTVKIIKEMGGTKTTKAEDFEMKVDGTWFRQRVRDIIRHVYKIDAL